MGLGRYKNLWEMRQPGVHGEREIFKCTECGAETEPGAGWNGAPERNRCRPGCRCNSKLTVVRMADFGERLEMVRFDGISVPTGPGENPVAVARRNYASGWDAVFGGKRERTGTDGHGRATGGSPQRTGTDGKAAVG